MVSRAQRWQLSTDRRDGRKGRAGEAASASDGASREGSAESGVSGTCGSRGRSQEVGSGPGPVACWAAGESLYLSGSQLLPEEQMWGDGVGVGESFTDGEALLRRSGYWRPRNCFRLPSA